MKIHPSALKHGVLLDDVVQAAIWATVVLVFDSGTELVFHAMKARPQILDLLP